MPTQDEIRPTRQTSYFELLVLRCQRGDRKAQEELIRSWESRLLYYLRRLVDNEQDAWDLLQETWLKVLLGIRSLREARALPVWLYRVARSTALNFLRDHPADWASLDELESSPALEEAGDACKFENPEQVHQALAQLSLPHREVLTLHFLEDLPVDEISRVTGVPTGTVKSRLHYAKRALRAALHRKKLNHD
jgi:RNA polymerase sigma-70 factor (ECF subfamily)